MLNIYYLKVLLENKTNIQERNTTIVEAYKQGYSQHIIAKVLELNQATVQRIIKTPISLKADL